MIDIRGLTKNYGMRSALQSVDFVVQPGITGLLGPNGSGKSTLIKAILGLVRVNSGCGTVLGMTWPNEVRALRDRIGYLPEDDCYILGLQGIESVRLMAQLSGLPGAEALRRAHEVMDFCDIEQERYRNVETYSTGMRQKLKFAQALVHDPDLVILDEPTTGLDPNQREEFLGRIKTLATEFGKTVILSTHILHDVHQICDNVTVLVKGTVRLQESLQTLEKPIHDGMHVVVVSDVQKLQDELQRQQFVVDRLDANSLFVHGLLPSDASLVWRAATSCGVIIQKVDQARNSLDKIFMQIAGAD
jgi:ABC-2 type transport system ATP-binding protein